MFHNMNLTGGRFQNFKLNKQVLEAIHDSGYTDPTPVQEKVIPAAMAGHDVLGIAPTGTGKTAGYLIPVSMKLRYPEGKDPRVLLLLPTRELAIQVGREAEKICYYSNLRSLTVYGGTGIKKQLEILDNGIDLLVATPGRFLDIYSTGKLTVKKIKTLVLDEADRMLDMGFIRQLHSILEVIPIKGRQNLLFSATFPEKVEKLSNEFLEFPVRIEIAPQSTTAATIEQWAFKVPNLKTKIKLLDFLLSDRDKFNRVIVFAKTRKNATDIYKFINRKIDENSGVIHANKDQNSRINAINSFSEGKIRILVSTDLTARGIDINQVSHVINFDVPVNYEDYVHRIGRTGRARQWGTAITFLTPPDELHMAEIEKITGSKVKLMEIPPEVDIAPTEKPELIEQAREADRLKRKLDPDFKGAFHKKKHKRHT